MGTSNLLMLLRRPTLLADVETKMTALDDRRVMASGWLTY